MVTCLSPIETFMFGDRVSSRFPLSVWNAWRLYALCSLLTIPAVHCCLWLFTPASLHCWRLKKEACHEFKASLGCIVSSRPVWAKGRERKEKRREGRDPSQVWGRDVGAAASALWKGREPLLEPPAPVLCLPCVSATPICVTVLSVWSHACELALSPQDSTHKPATSREPVSYRGRCLFRSRNKVLWRNKCCKHHSFKKTTTAIYIFII